MKKRDMIFQHIRGPQDNNGNPRRCFAVYAKTTGDCIAVFDEGYGGLPIELRGMTQLPSVNVSTSEYKTFLSLAPHKLP